MTYCSVCLEQLSKYTCPSCLLTTCSLKCSSLHKDISDCTGIRHITKFVSSINELTEFDLINDYRFLESADRLSKAVKLNSINKRKADRRQRNLVFSAVQECWRNGIKVKLLPDIFERSQRNTTSFNHIAETVFWKIDWIFCQAGNYLIEQDRLPETVTIATLLRQIICPKRCVQSEHDHLLEKYKRAGVDGCTCLIKVEENCWTKDKRFYQLDPGKPLKDNLYLKMIVEYPTVLVVLNNCLSDYALLTESMRVEYLRRKICNYSIDVSQLPLPELIKLVCELPRTHSLRNEKSAIATGNSPSGVVPFRNRRREQILQAKLGKKLLKLARQSKRIARSQMPIYHGLKPYSNASNRIKSTWSRNLSRTSNQPACRSQNFLSTQNSARLAANVQVQSCNLSMSNTNLPRPHPVYNGYPSGPFNGNIHRSPHLPIPRLIARPCFPAMRPLQRTVHFGGDWLNSEESRMRQHHFSTAFQTNKTQSQPVFASRGSSDGGQRERKTDFFNLTGYSDHSDSE